MKYQLAEAKKSSIRNCHCFQETKSIMVIELPVIPKSNGDEASFSSFFAPDTPTPSSKPDDMEDPKGQLISKGLFGVIVSTKKTTIVIT